MRRLRYLFDLAMKFCIRGCKYDWIDAHLDFEVCSRCDRAKARKARIVAFRAERDARALTSRAGDDFPTARVRR